jgi:predicted transcriptional regulator
MLIQGETPKSNPTPAMPEFSGSRQSVKVKEILSSTVYRAYPDEDLLTILKRFASKDVGHLPVLTHKNPDVPIGSITRSGLWTALETAKEERAGRKKS